MTDNLPKLQELKESFTRIYNGPNQLQQEYDLIKEAQRLNISLDAYRDLYKLRGEVDINPYPQPKKWQQSFNEWLKWFKYIPRQKKLNLIRKVVVNLIESGTVITIVLALGSYLYERPTRQKQANYQAWQIVNSAREQSISGGRIEALEDLNKNKISLRNLNVRQVNLQKIHLENAHLEQANFQKSDLTKAKLYKAHLNGAQLQESELVEAKLEQADLTDAVLKNALLIQANLNRANFERANLIEANLREANLQGANLKEANLRGADFEEANFKEANLQGADLRQTNLRGVKNITPDQIKAAKYWEQAKYSQVFRQRLGLPSETTAESDSSFTLKANNQNGRTITVQKGQRLTIKASGKVHTNPDGIVPICDQWTEPDGISECDYKDERLKDQPFMALIGIFKDSPFLIGKDFTRTFDSTGKLKLIVNDTNHQENAGAFKIEITNSRD